MIRNKKFLVLAFLFILTIPVYFASAQMGLTIYMPIVYKNVPPTPTPTLTPTPTPPPHTTGNVVITTIFYNGSGQAEPDEYVEIRNDDSFPIELTHWTLRDQSTHIFLFPYYLIQPNQVCRIYTNQYHPEWCGFSFFYGSAIWNNEGDCGYLKDSASTLISTFCYPQTLK